MSLPEPYPDLDELLVSIGEAGLRLSGIEASEGSAGNISMYLGWPIEVRRLFPIGEKMDLPLPYTNAVYACVKLMGKSQKT